MTTLQEPETGRSPEVSVVADVAQPTRTDQAATAPGRRSGVDRRRAVSIVAFILLALLGLYAFFSAFVEPLWYQNRQRALAAGGISLVKPKVGVSVGVLQAQTPFSLNVEVVQGDGPDQLRSGPGHRIGTPLPGTVGNSVIYGHASEWGGPFKGLKAAAPGNVLYLRTPAGSVLAYDVTLVKTVPAARVVDYLGRSTDYRLTLVTGVGGRFSDRRLVVVAVSGTKGQLSPAAAGTAPGPADPSPFGTEFLELLGWCALAAGVGWLLSRSHPRTVVVAGTTPIVVVALVSAFLEVGLLWSPLA